MAQNRPIPESFKRAYALLEQSHICELVGEPKWRIPGLIQFDCRIALPHPNPSGLPATVLLSAYVADCFPLAAVDFIPAADSGVRAFPHQDAESQKLCLPAEHRAPCNDQRLVTYVTWAKEWLRDAANGTLTNPGDPYELPDFSCKQLTKSTLATEVMLCTEETPESFHHWHSRIGQSGIVEFSLPSRPKGLFPLRFLNSQRELIRGTRFSESVVGSTSAITGQWILLPGITVERHRPAQTFAELAQLCNAISVGLERTLKQAWRGGDRQRQFGVLLIGIPIPKTVGGPVTEIHWQPVLIPNHVATRRKYPKHHKGKQDEGRIWNHERTNGVLAPNHRIHWGKVENVSLNRQVARGGQSSSVRATRFAIFGCGAIGSLLAESLSRGGAGELALFDHDAIEFGNLCRHTLDGRDVRRFKAEALADRLSCTFPTARISSHDIDVPWSEMTTERFAATRSLDRTQVFIDCTTDENAFLWLSRFARRSNRRLASLFINPHATLLTLLLSGRQTSCAKVFSRLKNDIENGLTPVAAEQYFADPLPDEQVLPGAGCWHPTFPAQWPHIAMLVFAALEHLAHWIEIPLKCDGTAIVLRRQSATNGGPVVETIFRGQYR